MRHPTLWIRQLVLISSDKAVRPTNVMGASKRLAELVVQSQPGPTCFSMVRFEVMLGSSGSVIALFRRQITAGGLLLLLIEIIRYDDPGGGSACAASCRAC